MIQSYYWKQDLLKHAKSLKPVKKPPNWSENLIVNFEKDLIVSFFVIRKLFELNKISKKVCDYKPEIFHCKAINKKINKLNQYSIEDNYDLEKETIKRTSIIFITNQFVHSCLIFTNRNLKDRNWESVFICSDYEKNQNIYRITIKEIIKIFELIGKNNSTKSVFKWNDKKGDYDVEVF